MNFFCRLLGHTWVDRFENPKIRWSASKNMSELDMEAAGEPRAWQECVRCQATRETDRRPQKRLPEQRRAS